jgi:predicted ArsR family transcriptional regulator
MSRIIASDRTADRLLFLLKTRGPMTTAELARRVGVTVPAARGHLMRFADEGLLVAEAHPAGVGRPAQTWALTALGNARFPDTHAETLTGILDAMRHTLGEDALSTVIAARAAVTEAQYRAAMRETSELPARIGALATLRTRDGYMAEVHALDDDEWLLAENHCPICAAARACEAFCHNELTMFRRLLGPGAHVERTDYLLAGARRCAYRIRRRDIAFEEA